MRNILCLLIGLLAGPLAYGATTTVPSLQGLPDIAPPGSAQPHLATTGDGHAVLSWLAPEDDGVALQFATLADAGWSQPQTVAHGTDWFVNWADFPSVVPVDDALWAAHWLRKRPGGTYAYDVVVSVSDDAGRSWSAGVVPHDDNTATEHGFVSLFAADGGVGMAWLDGRHTSGHHGAGGAMTLRSAILDRGGKIRRGSEIDARVCDCCQTDVAQATDGTLLVYRDRSAAEVRDISVVRAGQSGWTEPARVADDGWIVDGCPVNGPAIAARGATVLVVWFTGASGHGEVRAAWSADNGQTFSDAWVVAEDEPLGRVGAVALPDGTAVVSWLQSGADGAASVKLARVSRTGGVGAAQTVIETSAARRSGVPQMVLARDQLVLAWTEVSAENTTRVRSARLDWRQLAVNP